MGTLTVASFAARVAVGAARSARHAALLTLPGVVADEIAVAILVRAEPAASLSGCAALHAGVGRFRRNASEALPARAELRPAARVPLRAADAARAIVAEVRRGVHLPVR